MTTFDGNCIEHNPVASMMSTNGQSSLKEQPHCGVSLCCCFNYK